MIAEHELLAAVDRLEAAALRRWVGLGWITPAAHDDGFVFEDVDVARVRLICDLVYDIEIQEESLPVILSLLDQLHDTRRMLRRLTGAIDALPEATRRELVAAMHNTTATTG